VITTKGNLIASKLNSALDYARPPQPERLVGATSDKDNSLIAFNAIVYVAGFLFIIGAVWLVFTNFSLWPWPIEFLSVKSPGTNCDDGLYYVGRTAMGVLVLLVIGLTLVQGGIEGGEVRKSITISVMVMFYGLVAIHCHDVLDKDSVVGLVLDKFWAIVVAVTGYYFASRAYENAKEGENTQ